MGSLPWLATLGVCFLKLLLGDLGAIYTTLLGEDNWKLVPGLLWTLPCVFFTFTDFNLYPFCYNKWQP